MRHRNLLRRSRRRRMWWRSHHQQRCLWRPQKRLLKLLALTEDPQNHNSKAWIPCKCWSLLSRNRTWQQRMSLSMNQRSVKREEERKVKSWHHQVRATSHPLHSVDLESPRQVDSQDQYKAVPKWGRLKDSRWIQSLTCKKSTWRSWRTSMISCKTRRKPESFKSCAQ